MMVAVLVQVSDVSPGWWLWLACLCAMALIPTLGLDRAVPPSVPTRDQPVRGRARQRPRLARGVLGFSGVVQSGLHRVWNLLALVTAHDRRGRDPWKRPFR
jgi:hypothetical protein